jgi:muramoyltetrapeptide carboxypeptidase LdcA involved in peptidoglycan recycling
VLSNLIIPEHLKPGDKVAAVSLSSGMGGEERFRPRYEIGKKQFEETFGVQVVEMPNALKGIDFIYNNPQARVDDLHQAFLDPSIKAIISIIGGDDSVRLIDKIDLDIIRNNPKIVMGYSDATVTNFLCLAAGLRAFNGPMVLTQFAENTGMDDYVIQNLRKMIFSNEVIGEIKSADDYMVEFLDWQNPANQKIKRKVEPQTGWHYIQGDKPVSGRLIGGCGEVLAMFAGSKIWPKIECWKGAVLFLENSEDAITPTEFLYIMRNFGAQGIIRELAAIIFAKPCNVPLENWPEYDGVLKKVTAEFDRPDMPIVTHMDFGHVDPIFTIPFGAMATIDPVNKRFSIDESGCL